MSAGWKIWDLAHNEYLTEHPHVGAALAGVATLAVAGIAYGVVAPRLVPATAKDEDYVPSPNFNLTNAFEMAGGFVQGLGREIIGHHYASYLPLLIFIFLWTLVNNLLGMFPGFGSATDNLNTTLAMGASVFLYYNFQGFRAHGFKYLEHFTGHLHGALLLILGPVMFVIEVVSHMIRPVTLSIRLRSNVYADHTVYGIFTTLLSKLADFMGEKFGAVGNAIGFVLEGLGPVPIVVLGLLVAVIQAFVFTLLTTIYVGIATAHEEH